MEDRALQTLTVLAQQLLHDDELMLGQGLDVTWHASNQDLMLMWLLAFLCFSHVLAK